MTVLGYEARHGEPLPWLRFGGAALLLIGTTIRFVGFSSFTGLLKEAEKRGMLKLEPDAKARTFMVRPVE